MLTSVAYMYVEQHARPYIRNMFRIYSLPFHHQLLLNVTREGTSGPAVVYWRVQDQDGRDMTTDIAFLEGTIEMATGNSFKHLHMA